MDELTRERHSRWQNYRINQFSFTINLFLGLAISSIAFAINLKLKNDPEIELPLNFIIKLWSLSALLGSFASVTRLLDFRYTTQKIIERTKLNSFMASYCGPTSWSLFWGQFIFYEAGASVFIFSVIDV